ncbi:MAG: hypothetical protein HY077_04515 [Elusimicrobia bacterium]|nr:hypothetical protein [Elusimicrobiota bacterium]
MTSNFMGFLTEPFVSATNRFAVQVPAFAAAFLLLLAGMFTARLLRTVAERLFDRAHLDEYTSKVGINEVLARLGLGKSPSYVLSFLVYWFILFIFIVSAANAVNMTVVSDLLERFVLFLPVVIASLLVLFAGLLFGRFISEVVANAAAANNIRGGALLAQATYVVVLIFSAMTAVEQLGMKMNFISAAVQILLGSAGLAAAIAFGLGGKEVAAEIIRDLVKSRGS